jgi:hypothetical protein
MATTSWAVTGFMDDRESSGSVRVKLMGFDTAIGIWGDAPVRKAAASALRKVAASAVSTASSEIRNVYNIKKSDLDPRMTVDRVSEQNLAATIRISGQGVSLSYFGAKQFVVNKTITRTSKGGEAGLLIKTRKKSHTFQGVEVEVLKGRKTQLKSAFMAQMRSGHIGIMQRYKNIQMKKGKRKAIFEKALVSVATMIQGKHTRDAILRKVDEQWGKTFQSELNYQLSKGRQS